MKRIHRVAHCRRSHEESRSRTSSWRQWGQRILAAPPRHGFNLLAWVLPLVALVGGAGILGILAWRWTRVREPEPEPQQWALNGHPLGPEEERRLDEELARFDG